jgi:WXG100 protein secretion system (Wss), protein EssA
MSALLLVRGLLGISFTPATSMEEFTKVFFSSGTAIKYENSGAVITPAIPNRVGSFWGKQAIDVSKNSEILLTLDFKTTPTEAVAQDSEAGLGIFLIPQNITSSFPNTLISEGGKDMRTKYETSDFNVYGGPKDIEGGVALLLEWFKNKISILGGNFSNEKPLKTQQKHVVKLTVKSQKLMIAIDGEIIDKDILLGQSQLFLGFSAYSSSKVSITVTDIKLLGEKLDPSSSSSSSSNTKSVDDLLTQMDPVALSKEVKQLQLQMYHMMQISERDQKDMQEVSDLLNTRFTAMEAQLVELKTSLNSIIGKDNEKEYQKMKDTILTMNKHVERNKKIKESLLSKKPSTNGSTSDTTRHYEKHKELKSKVSRQFDIILYIFGGGILIVGIMGIGTYLKFRKWEKKHVL